MFIIPNVIRFVFSVLFSLSRMSVSSLFYVHYSECHSIGFSILCSLPRIVFYSSCFLLSVQCSRISPQVNLFSMFITANVIRSLFHCLIGQFFNCSPKLGWAVRRTEGSVTPKRKPRLCLFAFGISGGTSCLTDDGVIGPCNLVTERAPIPLLYL